MNFSWHLIRLIFFEKIEEVVDEPESPSKDAIVIQGNEKIVILRKMFN